MYFYLPDFYYKYNLNILILDFLNQYPEYFYDNINIGAVYGSFPGCIWNGGRALPVNTTDALNIKTTIEQFNNKGIPLRFTFTNCLLEEKHIYDAYSNLIVELANNGMNEILVNSPILEQYLKTQYPNFKYIISTTRCERNIDTINQLAKNNHLVVTDYRDNNDFNFMNQLEYKHKIELLINASCNSQCNRRQQHYNILSNVQLNFGLQTEEFYCPDMDKPFYDIMQNSTTINIDDILNKYVPMGFEHFKIEGRTSHIINTIEFYIHYLVKPEYKDKVRYDLIKYLWN